jgi:hypothetical protein
MPLLASVSFEKNSSDRIQTHINFYANASITSTLLTSYNNDPIMKNYTTIVQAIAALTVLVADGVRAHDLRGAFHEHRELQGDCPFSQIFSSFNPGLCIMTSGEGKNSRVFLGQDCADICPPDENGLMRLEGTDLCLQASHGHSLEDGSKMKVYPCNKDNELQQPTWIDDAGPHELAFLSSKYSEYCATNRGVKAVGGDPVIIKVCDQLRPVERQFWWRD